MGTEDHATNHSSALPIMSIRYCPSSMRRSSLFWTGLRKMMIFSYSLRNSITMKCLSRGKRWFSWTLSSQSRGQSSFKLKIFASVENIASIPDTCPRLPGSSMESNSLKAVSNKRSRIKFSTYSIPTSPKKRYKRNSIPGAERILTWECSREDGHLSLNSSILYWGWRTWIYKI